MSVPFPPTALTRLHGFLAGCRARRLNLHPPGAT